MRLIAKLVTSPTDQHNRYASWRSAPNDLHRLIQEVLARLGFDADPAAVARGVRKLNYGLPAEDEFSVLCAWLGKAQLIHKLDQQQAPADSRDRFQVPDLLMAFDACGVVLVEVKVCNDRKLSFKPDYYRRLRAYADLVGRPLLIAWKFHRLWVLVDIEAFALARKNFNLSHEEASKRNLLGILAGDVAYTLRPGIGIHFEMAKESLLDRSETEDGWIEEWQLRIANSYLADSDGKRLDGLHPESQQLLMTWPLEEREEHSDARIVKSFVVQDGVVEFAHGALATLLEWEKTGTAETHWRGLLSAPHATRSITDFHAALDRGLHDGVVRNVFHQRPNVAPSFCAAPTPPGNLE